MKQQPQTYDWEDSKPSHGPVKSPNALVSTYRSTAKGLHNANLTLKATTSDAEFAIETLYTGGEDERVTLKVAIGEIRFLEEGEEVAVSPRWGKVKKNLSSLTSTLKKAVKSPQKGMARMNLTLNSANVNSKNLLNNLSSALSPRDTARLTTPKRNMKNVQRSDPLSKLKLPQSPPPKKITKLPNAIFLTLSSKRNNSTTVSTQPFNVRSSTLRYPESTPSPSFFPDVPSPPSEIFVNDGGRLIQSVSEPLIMYTHLNPLINPQNPSYAHTHVKLSILNFPSTSPVASYNLNLENIRRQLENEGEALELNLIEGRVLVNVKLMLYKTKDNIDNIEPTGLPKILNAGVNTPTPRSPNSMSSEGSFERKEESKRDFMDLRREVLLKRRNKALKMKRDSWKDRNLEFKMDAKRRFVLGSKVGWNLLYLLGIYFIVGYFVNEFYFSKEEVVDVVDGIECISGDCEVDVWGGSCEVKDEWWIRVVIPEKKKVRDIKAIFLRIYEMDE